MRNDMKSPTTSLLLAFIFFRFTNAVKKEPKYFPDGEETTAASIQAGHAHPLSRNKSFCIATLL